MSSSIPVPPKPRPYRRLITSALHTRFVHAASIASLWHLILAGLAGDWYSSVSAFFWSFFPLGTAGIKALLFFMTSFFIFMLQISTLKLGRRCTPSNWLSIKTALLSYSTYATFFWYLVSAAWFCEVYVFTSPASKELGWIINGGYGEPDKLNERPIYLRLFFMLLGVLQASSHVFHDSSSLTLPIRKENEGSQQDLLTARLLTSGKSLLLTAATISATASFVSPFLYNILCRNTLWAWHISWARLFASIARSDSMPPNAVYIGGIMLRAFFFGFLLCMTWQLNLIVFEVFMVREPTKQNAPLSASSKDPNGTLLSGLNAKRELVKTFAFWELDVIAQKHPDRRKDIFGDFERPMQGPVFSAMLNAALQVLNSVQPRIDHLVHPTNPKPTTNPQAGPTSDQDAGIQRLPRLLPNSVQARSSIYQPSAAPTTTLSQRASNFISNEAKVLGSASNPWSPPVEKTKQLAIGYSSPTIKDLQIRAEAAQQSVLGRYLLTSPTRLIKSAILGTPNSNPALTLHAANAVKALLVASLQEDAFGKAVQGVPPTVQTLTKTIFAIEAFVHNHTNGGIVAQQAASDLEEVVLVHDSLKSALKELLDKFQNFLSDVGLSIRDLNEARKAAEDRELFKIVRSTPSSTTVSEGKSNNPEMEEVNKHANNNRKSSQSQSQNSNANSRRRKSQRELDAGEADQNRPGRLFSQLDQGSAYQASLRARKQSQGQAQLEANPLASGASRAQQDNVLGARDFNSLPLPAGGLQRRRVGEVR